ncbi:MAG: hypothetical protein FD155_3310 [Bacteroidetes bacterium]|nr:MAG: hypothetical protein FD155_3310 [Bacteroidota bacterium]
METLIVVVGLFSGIFLLMSVSWMIGHFLHLDKTHNIKSGELKKYQNDE